MTFLYVLHLILIGLIGVNCNIFTVSEVSVQEGQSISIPCLYAQDYINNVKCLCKGNRWNKCKYVVTTNEPDNSGKLLISDDTNQRIFTVTLNNLKDEKTKYWCAMKRQFLPHFKRKFELSFTDVPKLYVDQQEFTAFNGGNLTVRCHYDDNSQEFKEWCMLVNLDKICVMKPTGSIHGTTVTIDTSLPNVFTVTMSGLGTESSGWYWCATTDLQMPVRITVHELPSTTTTTATTVTTTMIPTTTYSTETFQTTTQHSSQFTSAEPYTTVPTNTTIEGASGGDLQDVHKSSAMVTIVSTTLVLLLLIIPAAFFGWKMILKHKKHKPDGPDITVGSHFGSDPDMHYATIAHSKNITEQQNNTPEETVTYSTIVTKNSVQQMTEPAEGSVIYSTLRS